MFVSCKIVVFLLPLEGMLIFTDNPEHSVSVGAPDNLPVPTGVERGTSRLKYLAQEHNMYPSDNDDCQGLNRGQTVPPTQVCFGLNVY